MSTYSIGSLAGGGSNIRCPHCHNNTNLTNIRLNGSKITATCGDCGKTFTQNGGGSISIGNR